MSKIYIVSLSAEYTGDTPVGYFTNPQAAQQLADAMQSNPDHFENGYLIRTDGVGIEPVDVDLPLQTFMSKEYAAGGSPTPDGNPQVPDEHTQTPIDQMRMEDDNLTPGALGQMASWVKGNCKFANAKSKKSKIKAVKP